MFWKKKHRRSDLVQPQTKTKRDTYRYSPPDHEPVSFRFKGFEILVKDLSAGGIAFKNNGFKKGDTGDIDLCLEDPDLKDCSPLSTRLTVLDIDINGNCHCSFDSLTEAEQERIHQFLLIKQKKEIRRKKRDTSH